MSNFEVSDRVVVVKNNHPGLYDRGYVGERGVIEHISSEEEYEVRVALDGINIFRQFDSSELELEGVYDALSVKPAEASFFNGLKVDMSGDAVNHPSHYADGWSNGAEVIDITEHLNFNRGNAVKYLSRAGKKGGPEKELEDLQKALWYITREVERLGGSV